MTHTDGVEEVIHDGGKVSLVTNEHSVCLREEVTNKLKPEMQTLSTHMVV